MAEAKKTLTKHKDISLTGQYHCGELKENTMGFRGRAGWRWVGQRYLNLIGSVAISN